jgi:hypothetical protein
MILSSSLIVFPFPFVGLMLTGEFTSLDEPTEVSEKRLWFFLPMDPNLSDLNGE